MRVFFGSIYSFLSLFALIVLASCSGGSGGGGGEGVSSGVSAQPSLSEISANWSTVSISSSSLAADGISFATVTVTLKDSNQEPVAGKAVSLSSSRAGNDTISAASGVSNAQGVVTFTVASTVAGSATFTALANSSTIISSTVSATYVAGAVSNTISTVVESPSTVLADGTATSTITVTLKDTNSNPVSGKSVSLSSSRGGTDTISAASGVSTTAGVVTFTVKSSTVGSASFTATDVTDSITLSTTPAVSFVLAPAAFNISGVTGAFDAVNDAYLNGGLTAVISWGASTGATSYDVTIYQNNGTSIACALVNTTSASYDFSTCNLTLGSSYKAKVTAKNSVGSADASNSLFAFSVNNAPVANTDTLTMMFNGSGISVDPRANDTDADSDALTITAKTDGTYGTISFTGTSVTYTPNGTNYGPDSFTYTISDGKGATATTTVNVRLMTTYTWVGAGANTNWATTGNWCNTVPSPGLSGACSGGVGPTSSATASHIAVFNSLCSSNCSASLGANTQAYQIHMQSSFAGTLAQTATFTLTVGAGGWTLEGGTLAGGNSTLAVSGPFVQSGGTFTGGSGAHSYTGNFTWSGGVYTATSNTTTATKDWTFSGAAASFTQTSGLWTTGGGTGGQTITFTSSPTFYDLTLAKSGGCCTNAITISGTAIVARDLTYTLASQNFISGGQLDVYRNVTTDTQNTATTTVRIMGSDNHTITGVNTGYLGSLTLMGTGAVNLVGTLTITKNFTYVSGNVNAGTSNVKFGGGSTGSDSGTLTYTPGNIQFYDVAFNHQPSSGNQSITMTGTMYITHDLNLGKNTNTSITGGTIELKGNITTSGAGCGSAAAAGPLLKLVGDVGTTQTITGNSNQCLFPTEIASSGNVNFVNTILIAGNLTYTSGNVNAGTSVVTFQEGGGPYTVNTGSMSFYDVNFTYSASCCTNHITITNSMNVSRHVVVNMGGNNSILAGTLNIGGNLTWTNGGNSTIGINFNGGGTQDYTYTAGGAITGNVTVSNNSTLRLLTAASFNSASQTLSVNSGSVNMNTYNLTLKALSLNGNTLTKNGGQLTVNGSVVGTGTLNGGTIN